MLWNPKFDKPAETKTNPFTLESLIAWLETMPADTEYPYMNVQECIACQYLQAHGYQRPWEGPDAGLALYARAMGGEDNYFKIAQSGRWTFGAALERARAALASSHSSPISEAK